MKNSREKSGIIDFLDAQGQVTMWSGSDLAEFRTHSFQAPMYVIVTCKYEKDPIKTAEKKWQHCFSH